jgi:pseudaminic acid cytidylyltransferase
MSIVAIIPARGGSKRIPRKNIRLFAGKPIMAYSIGTAQQSGIFDKIIVSTDDREIAEVARQFGAETPFVRPSELADDFATTASVIFQALDWLRSNGFQVSYVCCIYATAPFLKPEYISKGLELLREKNGATAFSVTRFSYPVFRALKLNNAGRLEMIWPQYRMSRSQDLPEAYHDAGQFYWADVEKFYQVKYLLSDDSIPIILPNYLVHDIDTPEDWETAERMFKAVQ